MDIIFCRGIKFTSTLGFRPILATKNFLETTRLVRRSDTRFWKLNFFGRLRGTIPSIIIYNNHGIVNFRKTSALQKLIVQLCPIC